MVALAVAAELLGMPQQQAAALETPHQHHRHKEIMAVDTLAQEMVALVAVVVQEETG